MLYPLSYEGTRADQQFRACRADLTAKLQLSVSAALVRSRSCWSAASRLDGERQVLRTGGRCGRRSFGGFVRHTWGIARRKRRTRQESSGAVEIYSVVVPRGRVFASRNATRRRSNSATLLAPVGSDDRAPERAARDARPRSEPVRLAIMHVKESTGLGADPRLPRSRTRSSNRRGEPLRAPAQGGRAPPPGRRPRPPDSRHHPNSRAWHQCALAATGSSTRCAQYEQALALVF